MKFKYKQIRIKSDILTSLKSVCTFILYLTTYKFNIKENFTFFYNLVET